jgi:eukaryotic-like serine/threonine-protein kinase
VVADETSRVIGKYVVGERMAAGGMAEVFHAEPVTGHFDNPIVLKQMLPALAAHQDFVSMFIEEARISTHLDHPNIVKVHDFEASDRGLFLVMELIDGPDLLSVLARCAQQRRLLEPELAAYIACHVLEALDYAHGAASPRGEPLRVVHRDVSPSNILISRRGHVKLADFGIARAGALGRTKEIASGTLKGKFGYMSPEQVRGEELDARSDVFSMGVVLAEMLMAKRLFSAPDDVELLLMVRRGDLSRLDSHGQHIPPELDAIVRTALAVELRDRYRSADAFRNALVDWLASNARRTGAGRLAELLRELERVGGSLCTWSARTPRQRSAVTISGPQTVLARRAASKASELGRIAFATAAPAATDGLIVELAPYDGTAAPAPRPPRAPTAARFELDAGELEPGRVVDLLCEIAREHRTGALMLRTGEHFREMYFASGNPVFVRCNVLEDRFGEFLVRHRVLTRDQLDRVLAVLDHFGGRLGQALVSLELIRPVDAVQLLAAQVSEKIVRACSWRTGSYEFRDGEHNPWPALSLELKTCTIVSHALANIPSERLAAWLERVADRRALLRADHARAFELAPTTTDRLAPLAAGRHTLREVLEGMSLASERLPVTAAAYVMWRCGALRLVASPQS